MFVKSNKSTYLSKKLTLNILCKKFQITNNILLERIGIGTYLMLIFFSDDTKFVYFCTTSRLTIFNLTIIIIIWIV